MTRCLPALVLLTLLALPALTRAADTDSLDLGKNIQLDLVLIKAGTFKMGSPETEIGRRADEEQIETTIKSDFYMGKFPVTRGQFARFVTAANYRTEAEVGTSGGFGWDPATKSLVQKKTFTWRNPGFDQTDSHPVVLVTYNDANAFAAWLSRQTKRNVSLPTEAQWEYACRAGTTTRFHSGDNDDDADTIAWHSANSENTTHEVGQKSANAFGLFDMSGNVYEWCKDVYGAYRPRGPVVGDLDKTRNILRGGSFLRGLADIRSAARYRNAPGSRNADNGFRIVVQLTPPPPLEANDPPPVSPVPNNPPPFVAPPPPDHSNTQTIPLLIPSHPTPAAVPAAHSSTGSSILSFFPACFCVAFLGIFAIIFVIIIRAIVGRTQSPNTQNPYAPPPPLVPTETTPDGFWIDASTLNPGDNVEYSYRNPKGFVRSSFPVESRGRQFIYTGDTPTDLIILGILAQDMASSDDYTNPTPFIAPLFESKRDSTPPVQKESRSRGFPSAY